MELWTRQHFFFAILFLVNLFVRESEALSLKNIMGRKTFLKGLPTALLAFSVAAPPALAFSPTSTQPGVDNRVANGSSQSEKKVAYKPLSMPIQDGLEVPIACWFPLAEEGSSTGTAVTPVYSHRTSVRKIGQMLAKWDIPRFVSRDYALPPTCDFVMDGSSMPFPTGEAPVVILAHGYLGSRFDLSHLAERLAERGFICIAAEYPESLAASYDTFDGLDRSRINQKLLQTIETEWNIKASSYGIVGHSLGCGTAMQTGDDSWTRVLISGFPRQRDGSPLNGKMLLLTSKNDGLMTRFLTDTDAIPSDFSVLDESRVVATSNENEKLPTRSILVFDRPDAPNHISFLAEGTNDAMIEFLSPLLPVARIFNIPVLDFDRYQDSRDSTATAEVVHPLVLRYLEQEMKGRRV